MTNIPTETLQIFGGRQESPGLPGFRAFRPTPRPSSAWGTRCRRGRAPAPALPFFKRACRRHGQAAWLTASVRSVFQRAPRVKSGMETGRLPSATGAGSIRSGNSRPPRRRPRCRGSRPAAGGQKPPVHDKVHAPVAEFRARSWKYAPERVGELFAHGGQILFAQPLLGICRLEAVRFGSSSESRGG